MWISSLFDFFQIENLTDLFPINHILMFYMVLSLYFSISIYHQCLFINRILTVIWPLVFLKKNLNIYIIWTGRSELSHFLSQNFVQFIFLFLLFSFWRLHWHILSRKFVFFPVYDRCSEINHTRSKIIRNNNYKRIKQDNGDDA